MTNQTSQGAKLDRPATAASDVAGPVATKPIYHSSQAQSEAQAALKAMAISGDATPKNRQGRFASLEGGLMDRIDRETTRIISRVHTRDRDAIRPNHDIT